MAKSRNAIKGMILLPQGNRIMEETIKSLFEPKPEEPRDDESKGKKKKKDKEKKEKGIPAIHLCDFDDVTYEIKGIPEREDPEHLIVSVGTPAYHEIKVHADNALKASFPGWEAPPDAVGKDYNCGVAVPYKETLALEEKDRMALAVKLANIKFHVLSGPFRKYFGDLKNGTAGTESFSFNLRSDTQVTLVPRDDGVTIIFAIDFQDKVDKVIARVFMQELADARRRVKSAPPFKWSTNPPGELTITENPGILGYASISVLKSHISGNKEDNVIATLIDFRTFIQYHLKCAKSYFHSRMRKRCTDLLKILNRAKVKFGKSEKKTKSGKTFKRG